MWPWLILIPTVIAVAYMVAALRSMKKYDQSNPRTGRDEPSVYEPNDFTKDLMHGIDGTPPPPLKLPWKSVLRGDLAKDFTPPDDGVEPEETDAKSE